MGLPLFGERRMTIRKSLTGLLPGRLQDADGQDIACRPVNVSIHGIGIVSDQRLDPNSSITFTVQDKIIELKIAWAQPGFGKRDLFRYGLLTTDQTINIEQLFLDNGCLK